MSQLAIALFGPTGIGKTSLSLKLAGLPDISGEIICADSMQVYRYMDIGTAKVTPEEKRITPHHLVDFLTPDCQFTAGEFKRFCDKEIPAITKRHKIPYIVGGTGFYFSTIINGIVQIPQIDETLRKRISLLASVKGLPHLYRMLEITDPLLAESIKPADTQRTLRALEVYFGTGRKLSDYYNDPREKSPFTFLKIGLQMNRDELYERINTRVDTMLANGLVDEVQNILSMGYTKETPGMKAIGYKEVIDYLDGQLDYDTMKELIKRNSRHYAKRQITWFKGIPGVQWFDSRNDEGIIQAVRDFLRGTHCIV